MAKKTGKLRHGGRRRKTAGKALGADVRVLARDAALAALTRLAELANSDDERVALAASQELLNRAFGKSAAAADDQGGARPLVVRIVRFGADESTAGAAPEARERGA